MKKKYIIIISIVALLIISLILFSSNRKSMALPASLRNLKVPEGAVAGDMISMGAFNYYGLESDAFSLIVQENRNNSQSRLIAIPVIRIKAEDSPVEPIFHLDGGPGMTNMRFNKFGKIILNHDIVLVGYRGADGSVILQANNAVISLKEAVKTDLLSEESLEAFKEAVQLDFQYMNSIGIDLNGYNMVEVVDDLELVRKALGYNKINLMSESYGTRLAQIYGIRYGQHIKRSVMIGVNPPGHFLFSPDATDDIIRYYSSLYKGEENLEKTFKRVISDIPDKWLWFSLNKDSVKSALFLTLFHTEGGLNSAMAFEAVIAAGKGDYSGLAFLSLMGKLVFPRASIWGDLFSKAVTADGDLIYDYRNQFTPDDALLGAPISKLHWSAGESWALPLIDQQYRTQQFSDVETLLISGNVDVSTPAVFARTELLPYLKNGEELVLSDYGHTQDFYTKQPEATEELLSAYFTNGSIKGDLFEHIPFSFETKTTFGGIMKIISVAFILIPILLTILLLFLVNRIRKKK